MNRIDTDFHGRKKQSERQKNGGKKIDAEAQGTRRGLRWRH